MISWNAFAFSCTPLYEDVYSQPSSNVVESAWEIYIQKRLQVYNQKKKKKTPVVAHEKEYSVYPGSLVPTIVSTVMVGVLLFSPSGLSATH